MSALADELPPVPTVQDVRRIAAIANPVLRNLEITHCYGRLSAAMVQRTGRCANWCTFATWASRQAGRTIRGEDLIETLRTRLGARSAAAASAGVAGARASCAAACSTPQTLLGRLTAQLHTPFDVFQSARATPSRAATSKVFAEIG